MIALDTVIQRASAIESIPDGAVASDDIPDMCADLLDNTTGYSDGFGAFISSLHDWYEKHGWLTRSQYDVLENAWHKMRGGS